MRYSQQLRWATLVVLLATLTACAGAGDTRLRTGQADVRSASSLGQTSAIDAAPARKRATRPNIVVVMMDDFSMDLVQTLRSAKQMRKQGASYSHAFATDSLCCVSRSSFFTGQYPHQTGVLTNTSGTRPGLPLGGWAAFEVNGNPERSFNVALQRAGYTTGFVGKYLNEYEWVPGRAVPPVVPGWNYFNVVFGSAYDGWDFGSSYLDSGRLRTRLHEAPPASASIKEKDKAYAGSVIERSALGFIRSQRSSPAPYFLEVAAYAPHNRTQPKGFYEGDPVFPPMFRDRPHDGKLGNCGRVACTDLTTKDLPGFGDDRANNRPLTRSGKPARMWNNRPNPFRPAVSISDFRNRAMMAQSVDRTVRKILRAVDDNTYVFFTSDNGFHLGQNGLGRGKGTAYDTDSHVPLFVVGPGVAKGVRGELVSNIDLAPTFEELAGITPQPYRSGASLVPTFGDPKLVRRNYVFLEHTAQALTKKDPDQALNGDELDRIPSYLAVRSRTGLLVRYDYDNSAATDFGYEFYSYGHTKWERRNVFKAKKHRAEVKLLLAKLKAFDGCRVRGATPVSAGCRGITS